MKQIILILTISLIMLPVSLKADHNMGGNLGYKHINGDTFKITLILLRDCSGIVNPATVDIDIKSSCFNTTITLHPTPDSGLDITPVCPYFTSTPCNPIQGQPILVPQGIQKDIYEEIFVVPKNLPCAKFTLSYFNCCRSSWIPAPNAYYFTAEMDRSIYTDNSSPVFNVPISTFSATNHKQFFDFSAYDPDGDELVYKLYAPHTDATGSSINYSSGLSYSNPFGNSTFSFDEKTGIIEVTPANAGIVIIGVRVEEYRNGEKIGYVEKDLQVLNISGSDGVPPPVITGFDSLPISLIYADPGDTIDLTIHAYDKSNPFVENHMTWNEGIPGANFTITGSVQKPKGTFFWIPDSSDLKPYPHYFYVTVTNDYCPLINSAVKAFSIQIGPVPTAIEVKKSPVAINIYPNPIKEIVNIETTSDLDQLTFFDMQGRMVLQHHIENGTARIPIHGLSSGVYVVKFTGKAGTISKKVFID